MHSLILRQVGISGGTPLFQGLNLTVGQNDRVGVIAGNGCGKTSLLNCLAGTKEPSEGAVIRSRGMRIAYIEQGLPSFLLAMTLREVVLSGLSPADRDENIWRADATLDEFETPMEQRERPLCDLSGGWQRLGLIARAWVMNPDALLLDEPTNHLDLENLTLLERWINDPQRSIPMVIASHDREFLDSCTTHTLFLRPEISKVYAHAYSRARAVLREDDAAEAAQLTRDMKEAERLRRSANELKNIGINCRSDAAQRKSKQMAQRATDMERSFQSLHKERSGDIRLSSQETHARVLMSFDDVSVYRPDGSFLFRIGKLRVYQGERLVILGSNGAGKSQLMELINRSLRNPESVRGLKAHPSIVVGYADQQMSHLPNDRTPFDHIADLFRLGDQRTRSLLAGAGFTVERQLRPIGEFSLGQKARLGMLALRLTKPNLYLLDEPTNHLDIPGQERLEEEILEQKSTCILISHDRHFVKTVGTRCLSIDKGKLVEMEFHRLQ